MKKDKINNSKEGLPSAVDNAANVMSKYKKKKEKAKLQNKKFSFPPIEYEKPPHY